MSEAEADNAGVIARPPVLYSIAFVLGMLLEWFVPTSFASGLTGPAFGLVLFLTGAGLMFAAMRLFRLAGTNVPTYLPTTSLVTHGPYRFTRNPIYLALTLIYVGLAVGVDSIWPLITLLPLLLVMHFGVVRREEAYLEQKFGEAYRDYRARVRRWI